MLSQKSLYDIMVDFSKSKKKVSSKKYRKNKACCFSVTNFKKEAISLFFSDGQKRFILCKEISDSGEKEFFEADKENFKKLKIMG